MRFGFIQGVAIREKDMVAVIFISPTHAALAIKFIQLQASPIMMSPQYSKDRSQGERTTVHTVGLPRMLNM